MHQRNVDQYIGQKPWQHVHEQIEEFPQQRLCLVLLHQRVVLGIIPNKKPVQTLFHSPPPPLPRALPTAASGYCPPESAATRPRTRKVRGNTPAITSATTRA